MQDSDAFLFLFIVVVLLFCSFGFGQALTIKAVRTRQVEEGRGHWEVDNDGTSHFRWNEPKKVNHAVN